MSWSDNSTGLAGEHNPFPHLDVDPESPWSSAVIAVRRTLRDLQRRYELLEQQRLNATNRLANAEATLTATHTAWKDTEVAWKETEAAWKATQSALEETQVVWTTTQARLVATQAELAEANRNLDDLRGSTSWKVTQPMRTVISSIEGHRRRSPGS